MSNTAGGLSALRVIEVGELVTAPFCCKLLADLGADVVKVEAPGQGDPARHMGPFITGEPEGLRSLPFLYLNTNKRSVTLDFSKRGDRDLFLDLVRDSHLLVENHPPGVMRRLRLGYQTLKKVNPALVMVSITPFGQRGPQAAYKANDFTVNHASGLAYSNGARAKDIRTQPPLQLPHLLGSYYTGLVAATAAMAGVSYQRATGHGLWADISMQEALASNVRYDVAIYTYGGHVPVRDARAPPTVAVVGQQPTADGYIDFIIPKEQQWRSLLNVLGNPDWGAYQVFRNSESRAKNWDALEPLIQAETRRFAARDLYRRCLDLLVPASPVNSIKDAAAEEQFQQRRFFISVPIKDGGECIFPGAPVKYQDALWSIRMPAPALGEHNTQVFKQLASAPSSTFSTGGAVPKTGLHPENQKNFRDRAPNANQGVWPGGNQVALVGNAVASRLPLEGVRVVAFGGHVALPYAVHLLNSLGAEVIRIDPLEAFDPCWAVPPFAGNVRKPGGSSFFNVHNRGNLSCTVRLNNSGQREAIKDLIRVSDVVVESYSYDVMESFGLSPQRLSDLRPDLITISCSGFGRTGPLREMRAHMGTIAAFTGLSSLNGYRGGPPQPPGGLWADYATSTGIALAAMVALHHRSRTGRGQYIDLSMSEMTMSLLGPVFGHYFHTGKVPERTGNEDAAIAPQNVYPCKGDDRWIAISVTSNEEWEQLCAAMGNPAWARQKTLADVAGRLQRREAIDTHIARWTLRHDAHELVQRLQQHGVPSSLSANVADLLADVQLRYRRFFTTSPHPVAGRRPIADPPFHKATPIYVRVGRPPLFGEHTSYVIRDLLGRHQELAREIERDSQSVLQQRFEAAK